MKNIHRLLIGTSIACFCGVYSGYAEDNHDHDHDHHSEHATEKRQLDSHEHGVSILKNAVEGQNVQLKLEYQAKHIND